MSATARRRCSRAASIVFFQFALFLVIGVMLFVYAQHAALPVPSGDPDRIFPQFIVHDMPIGLAGLVLASIFAIAMSNASGSLNSLASSSIIDLGIWRPTESKPLWGSRLMTLIWGAVLAALGLIRWGKVLIAGLTIASISYGGLCSECFFSAPGTGAPTKQERSRDSWWDWHS